ncbi:hypothetical protein TWF694_011317 [Orbilia ellipsospora]|uniref:DUF4470 domain-containing protein n=1 Tax=Orbilia ellipsospora TaxID=2528407 RepID=A0AAV9X586_9PEZI
MLHPTVFDYNGYFYPIGNTPALNLASHLPLEVDADVLLLGCGDLRHILFTLFTETNTKPDQAKNTNRKYHFTCCDLDGGVIARNILLLSLIIQNDSLDDVWPIYYDIFLTESSYTLLKTRVRELLEFSRSIEIWSASRLGHITIGSARTLSILRNIWSSWAEVLTSESKSDQLSKAFRYSLRDTKENRHDKGSVSVARSAGPLTYMFLIPSAKHFEHYWSSGTTDNLLNPLNYPNPSFRFSRFGSRFSVHYGTNPLAGFHLSTAVTPFDVNAVAYLDLKTEDFNPLIEAAKKEFALWCEAFRITQKSNMSTICLFIDDALELCASLHTPDVRHSPINATEVENTAQSDAFSKGYYFNHPRQWNVIDISNLIDHLGIYNILLSTLPLLRRDFVSHINTETLLSHEFNSEHAEEALNKVLGVDSRSIFALLGIIPTDFLTGHTGTSQMSDTLLGMMDSTKLGRSKQIHGRLVWKHHWSLQPEGNHLDQFKKLQFRFVFEPNSMCGFLMAIYRKLFESENHAGMFALIKKDAEAALAKGLQHNSRGTFSLILARVKSVTSELVDWENMIEEFMSKIASQSGSLISSCHLQEQDVLNHLYGVHTTPALKKDPMAAAHEFGSMNNLRISTTISGISSAITCVTLAVPIRAFKKLLACTLSEAGTPGLHLRLLCGPLLNNFGSLRRRFGKLRPEVQIPGAGTSIQTGSPTFEEDLAGWDGSGDVLFSCIVPTWFLLLEGCAVSVNIVSTPQANRLIEVLNDFQMEIFRGSLKDGKRVRLSTEFPSPQKPLDRMLKSLDVNQESKNSGNTGAQKELEAPKVESYSTELTSSIDQPKSTLKLKFSNLPNPKIDRISYRWDVGSDNELVQLLETKAPITTTRVGTSAMSILLGRKSHTIHFPYPVGDSTKLSIARKSKYIEIDAPILHQKDTPLQLRFPFGISGATKFY